MIKVYGNEDGRIILIYPDGVPFEQIITDIITQEDEKAVRATR